MSNLTQPTPKKNVNFWKIASFLYAVIIFLNENISSIHDIGFSEATEKRIKVIGIIAYFFVTYFNFNAINKNKYDGR